MSHSEGATRVCEVCGKEAEGTFLFQKNGCRIGQCSACGVGYAESTGFNPASYYNDEYFSGSKPDGYADYLGAESVLRAEFRTLARLIYDRKRGGRLLEIGCAYGFFLDEAREYFEVAGIEISTDAAQACVTRGLHVVNAEVSSDVLSRLGDFDVIVLLDVIEHLRDAGSVIRSVARHLNPDGILVVTTGDFGSFAARILGKRWRLMTPPQHLWFFTRSSMTRLAERCGLLVESSEYPWKRVPVSLMIYQAGRVVSRRWKAPRGLSRVGLPVNLFDAMRVVLRKPPQ